MRGERLLYCTISSSPINKETIGRDSLAFVEEDDIPHEQILGEHLARVAIADDLDRFDLLLFVQFLELLFFCVIVACSHYRHDQHCYQDGHAFNPVDGEEKNYSLFLR